jgi:hypothetical protein
VPKEFVVSRELINIERDVFHGNGIQGFLLAKSKELVLINYVYDFNLDGLMILRKQDISELRVGKTDVFQTQLLKNEGVFDMVNFNVEYNINCWRMFFKNAVKKHKYFILEEEALEEPRFSIGKIIKLNKDDLVMSTFTGIGRWEDETITIKHSDLTSCQIGNNYLNVYERYFSQIGT